jgi:hypothetical protein
VRSIKAVDPRTRRLQTALDMAQQPRPTVPPEMQPTARNKSARSAYSRTRPRYRAKSAPASTKAALSGHTHPSVQILWRTERKARHSDVDVPIEHVASRPQPTRRRSYHRGLPRVGVRIAPPRHCCRVAAWPRRMQAPRPTVAETGDNPNMEASIPAPNPAATNQCGGSQHSTGCRPRPCSSVVILMAAALTTTAAKHPSPTKCRCRRPAISLSPETMAPLEVQCRTQGTVRPKGRRGRSRTS